MMRMTVLVHILIVSLGRPFTNAMLEWALASKPRFLFSQQTLGTFSTIF